MLTTKRIRGFRLLAAAAPVLSLTLLFSACSSIRPISITSDPTDAMIQIDKTNVGQAPMTTSLDFGRKKQYVLTASKTGYFPQERVLDEKSEPAQNGMLRLVLAEDEAWKVTTTSEATNSWLRLQVDSRIEEDDVWQKLVDSVTSRYSSLEQLDNTSGYMRTIYQIRRFKGPIAEFRVRTRFLCSIASKTPLVYKFRIEAESSDATGDWVPYARVFKEDAALVEEIQNRLGVK
jgi:hypothetical protein